MKTKRWMKRVAIGIGVVVLAWGALPGGTRASAGSVLPVHDGIGGDFSAASSLGREVGLAEFRGRVVLLFFGYTSCQDICPTTLSHLKALVESLGDEAKGVQVLFVTVDPETDTAEHLKQYLARFDPRFVGLTGQRSDVEAIARLFMVDYAREHGMQVGTEHHRQQTFEDRAWLYSHSQQIYLLDKVGRTRGLFFVGSPLEEMAAAVRSLAAE